MFTWFKGPKKLTDALNNNPNDNAMGWFTIGHYLKAFCFAWNEI